jgi:hypothetical protein
MPLFFLTHSAELVDAKRVKILDGAKRCKRARMNVNSIFWVNGKGLTGKGRFNWKVEWQKR